MSTIEQAKPTWTLTKWSDGTWQVKVTVPGAAFPQCHSNKDLSKLRKLCWDRWQISVAPSV